MPAEIVLTGLKNCDTTRAACKWLDQHKLNYRFADVRTNGLDQHWIRDAWNQLGNGILNKKSTSWRALSPDDQAGANTDEGAQALLLENPTLLKRPVLTVGTNFLAAGFSEQNYQQLFQHLK